MYFALARRAAMRPGDSVLVLGSAGGVGADVVLPLTDGWAKAVRDHTDGRGVDIVVDPIGGPAFGDAIRAVN